VLVDRPRQDWTGPLDTETPTTKPTTYTLQPSVGLVTQEELLGMDGVLLDVRAEAEFAGEIFWPSGAPESRGRAGHVPGAINLPITELRTDTGFRPRAEMRAALQRRRIHPETPVTIYCTIGNRASQAWYALTHLLGYTNVAVYYGGWAEWGTNPTTPIER
jgi:thiosulfate/3-mercaptopyruvate sulfurtransferase